MFVGEGSSRIVFVFPTSTGEEGHETRLQDGSTVFRYDPALENDGWHNSSVYPVEADNPLNGNMYKPLYFDAGQAIHGANSVPPSPASKGCARLPVSSQDALIGWLGLGDVVRADIRRGPDRPSRQRPRKLRLTGVQVSIASRHSSWVSRQSAAEAASSGGAASSLPAS